MNPGWCNTDLVLAPTITIEVAKGVSLYMAKAIVNGWADEIVDVARVSATEINWP